MKNKVCFKKSCFEVDLAVSTNEKKKGLMFVSKISKGMLFVYEKQGFYNFHTKNVLIPLDIIWINENNRVVYMSKNTPKDISIRPKVLAKYVLELNSGMCDEIGLKKSDKLDIILNYENTRQNNRNTNKRTV